MFCKKKKMHIEKNKVWGFFLPFSFLVGRGEDLLLKFTPLRVSKEMTEAGLEPGA